MTWVMGKTWGNGTIVRKRVGGKPSFLSALHHIKQNVVNVSPILSGIISPYGTKVHFPRELIFHLTCKKPDLLWEKGVDCTTRVMDLLVFSLIIPTALGSCTCFSNPNMERAQTIPILTLSTDYLWHNSHSFCNYMLGSWNTRVVKKKKKKVLEFVHLDKFSGKLPQTFRVSAEFSHALFMIFKMKPAFCFIPPDLLGFVCSICFWPHFPV